MNTDQATREELDRYTLAVTREDIAATLADAWTTLAEEGHTDVAILDTSLACTLGLMRARIGPERLAAMLDRMAATLRASGRRQ